MTGSLKVVTEGTEIARSGKVEYDIIDHLWIFRGGKKSAGAVHTGYRRYAAAGGSGTFFLICA